MTCPLLYRFRVIDRLPEPPTTATARGTLVHAALERLFDLPAAGRTPEAARALLAAEWDRLAAEEPDVAALFENDAERSDWLASATAIVDAYFTLEDPRRLEPAEREAYVETTLESGLRLRGYIDRLDVAPGGEIRIVDYKTGRAPREAYEASALFQMKFYALVIWRLRGQVPRLLQLMYLAEGEVLRYSPDESDLLATERKVAALWKAIERARDAGDWRPRPSRLCDWCNHKALCPEFGGTPPPLPDPAAMRAAQPMTSSMLACTPRCRRGACRRRGLRRPQLVVHRLGRGGILGGGPVAGLSAAALPMVRRLPVAISRSTLPSAVRLASEQYPASNTITPGARVIWAWQAERSWPGSPGSFVVHIRAWQPATSWPGSACAAATTCAP